MHQLAFAAILAIAAAPAFAASVVFNIPTLDEVGLAGLIALVAGLGGWLARRRK